jgi:hypothetical protein
VVEEPNFNPEAEAIKQWWERFYLRENPFRRKDGLDAIDRRLYDAVVLRTKPLTDALGLLSRNPDGSSVRRRSSGGLRVRQDDVHRLPRVLSGDEEHRGVADYERAPTRGRERLHR